MEPIRIGILGARRGMRHARAIQYAAGASLTAICDVSEEALGRASDELGVETTFNSLEALMDSDVDAVIVATPMPVHVEHSIAALRAGKHVLCEVTAATSIEQCHELVEAANQSEAKYMFAENYCYIRSWSIVLEMVRAGLFGELYYGEADQIQDFKGGLTHPDQGSNWRTQELALRRGHQYITHNLGPLYQAFRERIKTVCCMGSGQHHMDWATADDTCVVLCETERGKLIRIRLDFFSTRPDNFTYFGLQGTGAAYEAPRGPGEAHKIHIAGKTPRGEWQSLNDFEQYLPASWRQISREAADAGYDGGTPLMIQDFASCIINDTPPPIDVIDAVNMTAPGLMSELSRERGGTPVEVPKFDLGLAPQGWAARTSHHVCGVVGQAEVSREASDRAGV
ncbi:MAG: Gfo/Idh/MocA family oxidoreductase [Planctomycetota bacterium]|nr:Gfo/Idh/MocA family oxidoreductase [Planctomycetota bacterium]